MQIFWKLQQVDLDISDVYRITWNFDLQHPIILTEDGGELSLAEHIMCP